MKKFNKIKGDIGEVLAINFLKKQKYKILEKNYSNNFGEVDIIALEKNTIVFCIRLHGGDVWRGAVRRWFC